METKKPDEEVSPTFLTDIKLWSNRLKLDKFHFKFIFILIVCLLTVFVNIYFLGFVNYITSSLALSDLMVVASFIFTSYMGKKILKSLQVLIIESKNIFMIEDKEILLLKKLSNPEENYVNFVNFMRESFKSKVEIYIPLILAIVYVIVGIFLYLSGEVYQEFYYIYPILLFLSLACLFILILVVLSCVITLINTFRCLNEIGTEEQDYPLNITYEDLKIGSFEKIGKFIISITIPVILFSTFCSILGLFILFVYKDLVVGYFFMILSLILTFLFSFLLYKNTINIHEAIMKFKYDLKYSLIQQIQSLTKNTEIDVHKKYKTISNIHDYYEKIDNVSDWPFNPTSIKKLVIILGSSIVPLIISFLGLG